MAVQYHAAKPVSVMTFPVVIPRSLSYRLKVSGLLISFEGGDGCGKSTQVARLAAQLQALGRPVVVVHEPGSTEVGLRIREILLHVKESAELSPRAELLLFCASRAQLVQEIVLPALARESIVLADRFMDSSVAYQGRARGLDKDFLKRVNEFATHGIRPNLTILLDLDPATARVRRLRRVRPIHANDRMETLPDSFQHEVREGYLELARAEPSRIKVIPADQPVEVIENAIWSEVNGILG